MTITPLNKSLLVLRLGVFIVMLMWMLDKFFNPEHAGKVFSAFYGIDGTSVALFYGVGSAQLLIIIAFIAGVWRRVSYGLVLAMHAVSTFSSWSQYLDPFNNLLFFAAWPMLAACLALYWLREEDTLFSFDAWFAGRPS